MRTLNDEALGGMTEMFKQSEESHETTSFLEEENKQDEKAYRENDPRYAMTNLFQRAELWSRLEEPVNKLLGKESEKTRQEKEWVRSKTREQNAWIYGSETPEQKAESCGDASKIYLGKSLSKSQKSKRAAKIDQKQQNSKAVNAELAKYYEHRDRAVNELAQEKKTDSFINQADVTDSANADLLKDFSAYAMLSNDQLVKSNASRTLDRLSKKKSEYDTSGLFSTLIDADLTEFEYKSDKEFTNNLAQKMAKLRALSHTERLLKEMEADKAQGAVLGDQLLQARKKIEMIKYIKEDYDNRIKMMSSKFYVLLAEDDVTGQSIKNIEKLNLKNADDGFKEYTNAVINLKKNKYFGKGVKLSDYTKEMDKVVNKEAKANDFAEYKELKTNIENFAKQNKYKMTPGTERAGVIAKYFYDNYRVNKPADTMDSYLTTILEKENIKQNNSYSDKEKKELFSFSDDFKRGSDFVMSMLNNWAGESAREKTARAAGINKKLSRTEYFQTRRITFEAALDSKAVEDMVAEQFREWKHDTVLEDESLDKRKDMLGVTRNKNMIKFKNGGKGMEEAARKDIDNLIKNIRYDQIFERLENYEDDEYADNIKLPFKMYPQREEVIKIAKRIINYAKPGDLSGSTGEWGILYSGIESQYRDALLKELATR